MITIQFQKSYKSIWEFAGTDLPDFTIITGVNGSGKSHFLQAIKNGSLVIDGIKANDESIVIHDWTSLVPSKSIAADPVKLAKDRRQFLRNLAQRLPEVSKDYISKLKAVLPAALHDAVESSLLQIDEAAFMAMTSSMSNQPRLWIHFSQQSQRTRQSILKAFNGNVNLQNSVMEFSKNNMVLLENISYEQLDELVPLNWSPVNIFQQNLSSVFAAYYRAFDENRYNEYRNRDCGESLPSLSADEFTRRYGDPPWDFLNRLLEEAGLDYVVDSPSGASDEHFEARLMNKRTSAKVSFDDLSSGEKIIMSFSLCLYNIRKNNKIVRSPSVLLFDEIDAPLHPSMTRNLIRVINQVLVQERQTKVIMATHSPSTVAVTPEGSLFRFEREPRRLIRCSREQAIQTLTSGYISVTENTRYVITEARQDRLIYTGLFQKLVERGHIASVPNLVFLQASDRKDRNGGGREQVRNWGTKLPAAGLHQIHGLIDRDKSNIPQGNVKVIDRYSLENYLLDPVILYAVLMDNRVHTRVFDSGIKDFNYYELRNAEPALVQEVVNMVCKCIEAHDASLRASGDVFVIEYLCGISVDAPVWLRDYRGHDLVGVVREAFKRVVKEDFIITRDDCADLIEMMANRLPEFIPVELVRKLGELQG